MILRIDGIRTKLEKFDIDGDGNTDEIESIKTHSNEGIMQIKDQTELGEVLEHQSRDIVNSENLSSVDFISNLNHFHVAPISAVEIIAYGGVISARSRIITRIIKRNLVSLEAMGRKQNVEVSVGKREMDVRKASNVVMPPSK